MLFYPRSNYCCQQRKLLSRHLLLPPACPHRGPRTFIRRRARLRPQFLRSIRSLSHMHPVLNHPFHLREHGSQSLHRLAAPEGPAFTLAELGVRNKFPGYRSAASRPDFAEVTPASKSSLVPSTPESVRRLTERVKKKANTDPQVQNCQLGAQRPAAGFLSDKQRLSYERNGHLTTRRLIQQGDLLLLREILRDEMRERELEALKHRVRVLCPNSNRWSQIRSKEEAIETLKMHGIEPVGFLQTFNVWRRHDAVRRFITKGALAQAAASLLGSPSPLRLYQDCIFLKEPGMGRTNWHSDLRMMPIDSNEVVTAWIPMRQIVARKDSGLTFASKSHRDFALPFWRHADLEDMDLSGRGYRLSSTGGMELGDVSWHHGWLLHAAPEQPVGSETRMAFSVTFFRDGARLLPNKYSRRMQTEDRESFSSWRKDLKDGAFARHDLLPIVEIAEP